MAIASYGVKSGDSLWKIATIHGESIPGSTTQAKVDHLVKTNDIKDPDFLAIGQELRLAKTSKEETKTTATTTTTTSTSNAKDPLTTIKLFGLLASDTSGRAMYATWTCTKPNTAKYKVRWRYYQDGLWIMGSESETTSFESEYCQSTYNAPTNATKVRFTVKPIAKDNNGTPYYEVSYLTEKEYDFSNNPPFVPNTPAITIKDLTLTASLDNVDTKKLNATHIEFEVVKDNKTKVNSAKATINTTSNYVSHVFNVEAGSEYKVRCRGVRGNLTSGWSEFSSSYGTQPSTPSNITTLKPNKYSDGIITVYIEWPAVSNATSYEIEYTTNKNYFDGSDSTTKISGIEFNHYEITSLAPGDEYFFRVRAVNDHGESSWGDIKSLVIGTKPAAPTTWSSTTTCIVGDDLILYWVHNAEDGSSQTYADIEIYANDDKIIIPPVQNTDDEDEKDKTSSYIFNTSGYTEGVQIKWRVRTAGVTKEYGDWSIQRVVDIYAKPTLDLGVIDASGEMFDILEGFPFYVSALAGPKTQTPIGYHLEITSNEFYETVDETGNNKVVNKGDQVYSKYFDISESLLVEFTAGNIDLETGISYVVTCSVTMNSGLSTDISREFTVGWVETEYIASADVYIDKEALTASITPYCISADGELIDDVTLSVYRREYDGGLTEIATDLPNNNNTSVTDPHPALDYARYRIVSKTKTTGATCFYDAPGYLVGGEAVVIQWNENWVSYDANDEYSIEKPSWSGSLLKIPYNIDVSDSHSADVSLIAYVGRKRPVSYYGTQLGETSTWNMEVPKDDKATLYGLRRLAIWMGDVYVREPSGSGYWANISVSFSQKHSELTIPVTLSITRVEGGV